VATPYAPRIAGPYAHPLAGPYAPLARRGLYEPPIAGTYAAHPLGPYSGYGPLVGQAARPHYHEDLDRKTYVEEPVLIHAAGTHAGVMPSFPEHISTVPREEQKPKESTKSEGKQSSNNEPVNFYIDPYHTEYHGNATQQEREAYEQERAKARTQF
jgi:hypothetical protein